MQNNIQQFPASADQQRGICLCTVDRAAVAGGDSQTVQMNTNPTHKDAKELELRTMDVPWFKTSKELITYIEELADRQHDYGTCVYAMSMAATAAFYFISGKLGVTGFQASCADMDILRRTRGYKHGFMILNYENLLYPQCDLIGDAKESIDKALVSLAPKARELLTERHDAAHPGVVAHWQKISLLDGGAK